MKRALLALGVVIPAVGAGFYCSSDQAAVSYPSYDAMKSAGFFSVGWVPMSLPGSTRDFQGQWNGTRGKGLASFHYSVGDTAGLDAQCTLLGTEENLRRYDCDTALARVQIELTSDGSGILTAERKVSTTPTP